MTSTTTLIDTTSDLNEPGEAYNLIQIWQVGDLHIRTTVHHDLGDDNQSRYQAELWNAGWIEVCHILGRDQRGKAMPSGYYGGDRGTVRTPPAQRMAVELLGIALRTIGITP